MAFNFFSISWTFLREGNLTRFKQIFELFPPKKFVFLNPLVEYFGMNGLNNFQCYVQDFLGFFLGNVLAPDPNFPVGWIPFVLCFCGKVY